jgi:hypothetical protein
MVLCWVARYTKSNCPSAKTENSTPPSIKIYAFPLYGVWFVDSSISVFAAFTVAIVNSSRSNVLKFFIVFVLMYLLITLLSVVQLFINTDHAKIKTNP